MPPKSAKTKEADGRTKVTFTTKEGKEVTIFRNAKAPKRKAEAANPAPKTSKAEKGGSEANQKRGADREVPPHGFEPVLVKEGADGCSDASYSGRR
jgi:hypothetical protein